MVIWKQNEELLIYAIYNKIKIKIISLILKNVHRLKKRLHTFEGPTLFASIFNTKNTHRSTTMTVTRHFMTLNFGYLILKPNRFSILRFEIKTLCFFKKSLKIVSEYLLLQMKNGCFRQFSIFIAIMFWYYQQIKPGLDNITIWLS